MKSSKNLFKSSSRVLGSPESVSPWMMQRTEEDTVRVNKQEKRSCRMKQRFDWADFILAFPVSA